jgi:hypothetical protein
MPENTRPETTTPPAQWRQVGTSTAGDPVYAAPVGTPPWSRPDADPIADMRAAADPIAAVLDAPTLTAPQAQGDLMILPWPTTTAPGWRQREAGYAMPLPTAGVAVLASHHVIPLTTTAQAVPALAPGRGSGQTLGTLFVPDGCSVLISHDEHEDLRVGPGVYVLRRQRRFDAVERRNRMIAD